VSRALRLLLAALGGYAFAAGLVAMTAAALPCLGWAATESATLGGLLGVPAGLAILLWVVATMRPVRTAVIVFAVSAALLGAAPLLAAG